MKVIPPIVLMMGSVSMYMRKRSVLTVKVHSLVCSNDGGCRSKMRISPSICNGSTFPIYPWICTTLSHRYASGSWHLSRCYAMASGLVTLEPSKLFGWVLRGSTGSAAPSAQANLHITIIHISVKSGDDILQKFWEIKGSPTRHSSLHGRTHCCPSFQIESLAHWKWQNFSATPQRHEC